MSQSTHVLAVKAADQTGGAFASIQSRAAAVSAKLRSMLGGALAGAGAYLGAKAIAGYVKELGNLSDMAMRTGASVETLTKASTAFQVAGLNVSVESLARSFMFLKKNTGEGGMDAFYKAAKSIAAIEDPAKRGAELVKKFGRAGLELQPLIDGGADAIEKMQALTSVMPGVSQAAADAGDAAADSLTILGNGAKNLMLEAVGKICELWGDEFPGGVRAGALNAINWLEYALKKMWHSAVQIGAKIGAALQAMWNWAANDYTWEQAWNEYEDVTAELDREFDAKRAANEKAREDYKAQLSKLNVDDLANPFGKNPAKVGEKVGEAAAKAATRITNQLMLGGSNASTRLAILGPEYQNEQKKQTSLLEKIEQNTAKEAERGDGESYNVTDLGV